MPACDPEAAGGSGAARPRPRSGPDRARSGTLEPGADGGSAGADGDDLLRLVGQLFGDDCYTLTDLRRMGRGIVHASPAFARFSGYEAHEVVGRDLGFLQRDDNEQDGNEEARRAIREGRPCTVVLRNYRRDGTLFFNEQRHFPLRDEAGRVTHVATVQRDVSERVHTLGVVDAGGRIGRRGGGFFGYSVLLRPEGEPELLWIGEACRHLTGHSAEHLLPGGPGSWVHPDDRDAFREALALRRAERSHRVRYRLITRDGRVRWVEDHGQRSWNAREASAVAVHALVRDVTAERRGRAELWQVENVDALTGLPNVRLYRDRVEQAASQARAGGSGAAVAVIDLDAFSFVDETIGRAQGDRLLQEVAKRLRRTAAPADALARLDGDRFGLVLADVPTPESLAPRLAAFRACLAGPLRWRGGEMRLSATFGVARLGGEPATQKGPTAAVMDAERAIDAAERALERAKRSDRGGWRLADASDHARLRARENTEAALRNALANDELVLHYQPRMDIRSGELAGVEALVRWLHPSKGLLKPHAFLPSLEAAGLDPELFRWVLPRALAQAASWRAADHPCRVAVNVGWQTLEHPDFERWVRGELERMDLNPALLELELTEGTPVAVFERHVRTLASLRESGVRISLDDFGVATASLSQLQRLPLDGLKIDKRFIDRLVAGSKGDREMVRAIIAIGKSLDLTVVAEGIETDAQRNILRTLRCDEGQGYLYSQAVPADFVRIELTAAD